MKKTFILLALALAMVSCSTSFSYPKYTVYGTIIDYSKYTKKGFFITEANSVSFDYVPLGTLTAVSKEGRSHSDEKDSSNTDGYLSGKGLFDSGKNKKANVDEAISLLHSMAVELGGNGIINLKIEYIPPQQLKYGYTSEMYIVTGMAIKK